MRMATSSSTRRGRQSGADLKPPQAAVVKSDGGERCGKVGTRFRQARLREASASEPLQKCRKRIRRCQNRGVDPSSGISLGDALRLPKRHPACRRCEAQSGSGTERENLAGDVKGKGASGSNREAESTDAPERGGLPCSSAEAGVMLVERRGQVIAVGSEPTGNYREEPDGSAEGGSLRAVGRRESVKSGSERQWKYQVEMA